MIRVMLVEDDPMVAELNRLYLQRVGGFEVVAWARGAEEALARLGQGGVDLLLLDVFMPGPSGMDLLAEVRRIGTALDVIFVTASRDPATLGRALQLGAVDYLIKPFGFERLKQALDHYRETRRIIQSGQPLSQEDLDRRLGRAVPEAAPEGLPKGLDRHTLDRILAALQELPAGAPGVSSEELAGRVGLSRVSVRKYLEFLCGLKVLRREAVYGTPGRPLHRYRLQPAHLPELRRYQ